MDLTGYELEPQREDEEFALYRARQRVALSLRSPLPGNGNLETELAPADQWSLSQA